MSTTYTSYGYGGSASVADDIATFVEQRLQDLVPDIDRDERFRVYGVPGEGYVEITALTADEDLASQIKEALSNVERELKRTGVATAMFTRLEPRVPTDAYEEIWRWIDQEVQCSPGFVGLATSEANGGAYEWQDWGVCRCDVESDGKWGGHLRMFVGVPTGLDGPFVRRQFEADVSGSISRDGDIEGSFTNWIVVDSPTE